LGRLRRPEGTNEYARNCFGIRLKTDAMAGTRRCYKPYHRSARLGTSFCAAACAASRSAGKLRWRWSTIAPPACAPGRIGSTAQALPLGN